MINILCIVLSQFPFVTMVMYHMCDYSINDNESCADLLMDRLDMDGVNSKDNGGR